MTGVQTCALPISILEAVKAAAGAKTVKTLEIYVKPEDGAAYYVVNGKDSGKADL